ncbi:MAG TPA: helix-turn-helix domain-containing protein [Devosia sp.]|nr:helix-turn-helix domain-containing protein [Devosia sp.]
MLNQPLALTSVSKPTRDPAIRDVFAQGTTGPVTFFPADTVIYAQGEAAGPLYLVEFGAVRICRVTADGRRQINSFHFAGEVFGFEAGAEHSSYAESIDGAGIRILRAAGTETMAPKLLNIALRGLTRMQEHLLLLGRMSANERMVSFLIDLMDRQDADDVVMLPMQRNDIADYLGMTFETVSRVLRSLRDRGLIHVPSVDRVEILDADALHDQLS